MLVLNIEHANLSHVFLQHRRKCLEIPLILWSQESQRISRATDTGCATASVHVDLSVERALIVDDVLHVGDIKASRGNICADKDSTLLIAIYHISRLANLDRLVLDLLNCSFEAIQRLKPLLLLHLRVQAMVLHFEEVENAGDSLGARDRVREDDC